MSEQELQEDVVWEATVDDHTWLCKVVRIQGGQGYRGHLTVTRAADGEVILAEEVGLAYGAIFGPDVDDVAGWQTRCIDAIDNHATLP